MSEDAIVDCGAMIKEMLGLDPGMLGVMGPAGDEGNDRALLGLGRLVRRSLELSIQLRERKSLTLRLKSNDEQARAWGFGDVASSRIGMLLLWASLRTYRYCRGFSYAPLMDADEKVVDMPPRADAGFGAMSNAEIVGKAFDSKPYAKPVRLDETTPDDVEGASLWDLMRDVLGLYTADLASVMYDTANEMVPDLVSHPQQLSGHGLLWFLQGVAQTYSIMRERDVRRIQLRTDKDALEAELPGGAKTANLMTVMAASLFADEKHHLVLLAPKERSEEEVDLLRRVACWVYLNYNCQVFDGLSLLCESNRHFGKIGLARLCIADRLLHSVRHECDPKLERMPVPVQAIEAGLDLPSRQQFWQDAS